jgi:diguanylate cyclase (GGDEF)-like protein
MRRIRYLFLLLITLGFAVGIATSLVYNQRNSQMTSARIQLSAWSLAQLEFEYLRFVNTLQLFQAGGTSQEKLQLHYDLLWSRLETFLSGEENSAIRERFDAGEMVAKLFSQLRSDEALIFSPTLQAGAPIVQALERYNLYLTPIRQVIISNFTGPEAARIIDEIHHNQRFSHLLLLGLLFCGGGLILMFYLESRQNRFLARNDPLTCLPNRNSFQTLQNDTEAANCCALAVIELSNFRSVNECISHEAGDRLLQRIGETLNRLKPQGSFIARVAGDEFIMTFPPSFPEELVISTLNSLTYTLSFDFQSDKHLFQVGTRIGLSFNPDHSFSLQKLYYFATLAARELRAGKHKGLEVFSEEISNRYLRSQNLLDDLKRAMAQTASSGLSLHYQPIVGLIKTTIGVEALLRWKHPTLGYISPLEVVELAENNQLGQKLGEWILQRLRQDLLRLPQGLRETLYFSVNLSPAQFTTSLPGQIEQWLAEAPIRANQLVLEMTESISVANFNEGSSILHKLNEQGIAVALDDFGTGYSSLSYLRELRVQRIKIDKSFIQGISRDRQLQRVVRSIVELCHTFRFTVTCEGIEDESDAQKVIDLGCDHAQGYWYGKPMPVPALITWHADFLTRPTLKKRLPLHHSQG